MQQLSITRAHVAKFGKPVIMSTGMNTIESVSKAVAIFEKHNVPLALLHTQTVSNTNTFGSLWCYARIA